MGIARGYQVQSKELSGPEDLVKNSSGWGKSEKAAFFTGGLSVSA